MDPDFISIDIFKELFLLDEEKLQEPIKKLEALSLMKLIYQDGQAGLQLHRLMQDTVQRCINKQLTYTLNKKEILDYLFQWVTNKLNNDWENAKILYPHIIKILNDYTIINKFRKASLYQKIGKYNECVLYKFEDSLKYCQEALKAYQAVYQSNNPNIAHSFNNIGWAYEKLYNNMIALKYKEASLKMYKAAYQNNHTDIANSLFNVGITYEKLGDINKAVELCKQGYLMHVQTLGLNHFKTKNLKNYLEKNSPEFIKNNETREFILQRGILKKLL